MAIRENIRISSEENLLNPLLFLPPQELPLLPPALIPFPYPGNLLLKPQPGGFSAYSPIKKLHPADP